MTASTLTGFWRSKVSVRCECGCVCVCTQKRACRSPQPNHSLLDSNNTHIHTRTHTTTTTTTLRASFQPTTKRQTRTTRRQHQRQHRQLPSQPQLRPRQPRPSSICMTLRQGRTRTGMRSPVLDVNPFTDSRHRLSCMSSNAWFRLTGCVGEAQLR